VLLQDESNDLDLDCHRNAHLQRLGLSQRYHDVYRCLHQPPRHELDHRHADGDLYLHRDWTHEHGDGRLHRPGFSVFHEREHGHGNDHLHGLGLLFRWLRRADPGLW
jgi:hypothetical protein